MLAARTILVGLVMMQYSASVFGNPFRKTIYKGLEGMRRARCAYLRRSSLNHQFPWYCKPGRVTVKYLNVGGGWFQTNSFSFTGNVLRSFDVQFVTEQDGTGSIVAKFNGAILRCTGFAALKRKTCTIPRRLRPWRGVITVSVLGRHPSTRFLMSGTPVCPRRGFTGYNCDQDINECVVYKNKRLCAWKDGCVNTYGGYKCKCPPGYKVSSKDFRLCERDVPRILSRPSNITAMFFRTVILPCQYTASGPVTVKWQINNRIIAIKRTDGSRQTINRRLTMYNNGALAIHNTSFGDAGRFFCIVQNVRFYSWIAHDLKVESRPLMSILFLVNGKHTASHVYRVGDDVIIDCQVIASPAPVVTWSHGQQLITPSARRKVILGPLPKAPAFLKGKALQLQLRIIGVQKADAGVYSCKALNRHGITVKSITLRA